MTPYQLRRVPVSMGGPAIVVQDLWGRVVLETKDFSAAVRERDRLNAGGSEVVPFRPGDRIERRLPDGTVHVELRPRPAGIF